MSAGEFVLGQVYRYSFVVPTVTASMCIYKQEYYSGLTLKEPPQERPLRPHSQSPELRPTII